MTILSSRVYYKPFVYPWAYDYFQKQAVTMHWSASEVSFKDDLNHFNSLNTNEKEFISKLLSFFTQSDNDIGGMYVRNYLPTFSGNPEIRMMLLAFASMESIHADAYASVNAVLNLENYKDFLDYPSMKSKHDYLSNVFPTSDIPELMKSVAVTSAFGEGLQLYGSFIMLLSFVDRGLMSGMGDVVQYSMRDETVHVEGLLKIFDTLKSEYPEYWIDTTKRDIYQVSRDMVTLEINFIETLFEILGSDLPNLSKEQVIEYIKYLADHRLGQLGLKANYFVKENPIPWLDKFFLLAHEDLFSATGTEYNRDSGNQDWDSLF